MLLIIIIIIHARGDMNVHTKLHGSLFKSYRDISLPTTNVNLLGR